MTKSKHIYSSAGVYITVAASYSIAQNTVLLSKVLSTFTFFDILKSSLGVLIACYLVYVVLLTIRSVKKKKYDYTRIVMTGMFAVFYMLLMSFIFIVEMYCV